MYPDCAVEETRMTPTPTPPKISDPATPIPTPTPQSWFEDLDIFYY